MNTHIVLALVAILVLVQETTQYAIRDDVWDTSVDADQDTRLDDLKQTIARLFPETYSDVVQSRAKRFSGCKSEQQTCYKSRECCNYGRVRCVRHPNVGFRGECRYIGR